MTTALSRIMFFATISLMLLAAPVACDRCAPFSKHEAAVSPAAATPDWHEEHREIYWGIPATIKFKTPRGANPAALGTAAWEEFARIGDIFNPFNAEAETARLNAADKTGPRRVSSDLLRVMRIAEKVYRASGGAFDPTLFPLKKLWKSAVTRQTPPAEDELADAVARCGFDAVTLPPTGDGPVMFAKPALQCDFGGIVKGYAVDRVMALLASRGVTDALVQLGGEVAARGDNDGKPWRVGVQNPLDMNAVWGVVEHRGDLRVSTSGNYRQPLIINGVSYYHIFDPATGHPVSQQVLGVTVIATGDGADNATLDAAATAITVLGETRGLSLAGHLKTRAVIITRDAAGVHETTSPDMAGIYKKH